ncbi:shikimate kinase [Pacificimonas flava]|uniref:Shikimate kinase n=2 Tax=Pacificimonas TaxID=1960290 RepID=A0A219B200_9SPHN|nr:MULTISPECIES: shikimate kinase [Pacificimonas]MBZ6377967.1 shikimate kinase [Pacificimonas aurantium]OWV32382.1 shikimate kinase [Pacificimonas flava]
MLTKRKICLDGKACSLALIGLMGTGKSTVGQRLAATVGLPFVDADDEIETAAGMSINEIFDRFGEAYFRDGERRVIRRIVEGEPCVLATGGGAFMDTDTRGLLAAQTVTVWLNADIETLAERVSRRDNRPLVKGKDPAAVLRDLAAVRNPVYAEARIHVRSGAGAPQITVDAILERLEEEKLFC